MGSLCCGYPRTLCTCHPTPRMDRDLGNCFHDKAVDEGRESFKVGRANNEVAIGDLIETLLNISFASKDAMLDWEWLGVDLVEWPPQNFPLLNTWNRP